VPQEQQVLDSLLFLKQLQQVQVQLTFGTTQLMVERILIIKMLMDFNGLSLVTPT
jgi:hypothetical protein